MVTLTSAQIKEIADQLDSDFICYIDPSTGELEFYPDFDNSEWDKTEYFSGAFKDPEELRLEKARFKEIKKKWKAIYGIDSRESFEIMEAFAEQVQDRHLKDRLLNALSRKRPFANFRDEVDDSGPYRQKWFDF